MTKLSNFLCGLGACLIRHNDRRDSDNRCDGCDNHCVLDTVIERRQSRHTPSRYERASQRQARTHLRNTDTPQQHCGQCDKNVDTTTIL